MATLVQRRDGRFILQYLDAEKNRSTITLGKVRDGEPLTKRNLRSVKSRIERLIAASISGETADRETLVWVRDLEHDSWGRQLRQRLGDRGLIPRAEARRSRRLIEFVDQYIANRTDVKPSTATVWKRCRNHLDRFFGNVELRRMTIGDAKDFRRDLLAGDPLSKPKRKRLAEDTVRRTCGVAKQFFGDAVQRKLIDSNPFEHRDIPTATGAGDGERREFITRDLARQVLDILPDAQWKLMFALARYGGLRCPSEVLSLTWGDIDWNTGRILVTSPKTEHHDGGGSRMIPLFPELRPYLQMVLDESGGRIFASTAAPVITRYRKMDSNYGVLLGKHVRRASITMWAKPWQNLRSTRETELAEQFPLHVVCEWIGNSVPVAQKHYLQVTDDHFERATGPNPCSAALHDLASGAELDGNSDPAQETEPAKTPIESDVSAGKRQQPATADRPEWALQDLNL